LSNVKKYAILWLPPVLLLLGILFWRVLFPIAQWLAEHIVFCVFYEVTGLYCMGCGGTRSLMALLQGDIPRSFHNNPAVLVLLVTFLLLYAEKVAAVFGKNIQIVPRSLKFWLVLLAIQTVWNIVRNFVPAMLPIS